MLILLSLTLLFYKVQSICFNKWCLLVQSLFYLDVLLLNVSPRSSCIKSANTECCNVYSAIGPWTMTYPPIILVHAKPDLSHLCSFCMIFMHIHIPCDSNQYIFVISSSFNWILAVFIFTYLMAGTLKYKQVLKIILKFILK